MAVPLVDLPGAFLIIGSHDPNLRALAPLTEIVSAAVGHVSHRARMAPGVIRRVRDIAVSIDERDGYTADHSQEVVALVRAVAARLGMERAEMRELELAALLHDVGKIRVPDSILQKPGALDALEFDVMARHPIWGAQLLSDVLGFGAVAGIVRYHHERWDGGGYPDGLVGDPHPACQPRHQRLRRLPRHDLRPPLPRRAQHRRGAHAPGGRCGNAVRSRCRFAGHCCNSARIAYESGVGPHLKLHVAPRLVVQCPRKVTGGFP